MRTTENVKAYCLFLKSRRKDANGNLPSFKATERVEGAMPYTKAPGTYVYNMTKSQLEDALGGPIKLSQYINKAGVVSNKSANLVVGGDTYLAGVCIPEKLDWNREVNFTMWIDPDGTQRLCLSNPQDISAFVGQTLNFKFV